MRKVLHSKLQEYFSKKFYETRKSLSLTQSQMAEKLQMDVRSYCLIENAKTTPGTLTIILFLLFLCDSPSKVLSDLARIVKESAKNVA